VIARGLIGEEEEMKNKKIKFFIQNMLLQALKKTV
jgi:hypothetical protein